MKNVMRRDFATVCLDIGRGFVKCILDDNGTIKELKFNSVTKEGYDLDINADESRNHFRVQGLSEAVDKEWFVGLYALDQKSPTEYTTDSKVDVNAQALFVGALNALLPSARKIKVMMGVPKSMYTKEHLAEIKETYKGKELMIHDKVSGRCKVIIIEDINIFTEASASAMYLVKENPSLEEKEFGIVNCGFRTTELAYYKPGVRYIEGLSSNVEFGNMDILTDVKKKTKTKKALQQIDMSTHFDESLQQAYTANSNRLTAEVETCWRSEINDIEVYVCGGTSTHLELPYTYIRDSQFATVRGLHIVANEVFTA